MARWHSDRDAAMAEERLGPVPADDPELAALDELGSSGEWTYAGRRLRLTNLGKQLFPGRRGEPAATKRDLIRYYATVAPVMLPHLADRPLNLRRFPDGVDQTGFWHKEAPAHAPDWIGRWHNDDADEGETQWYTLAREPAVLAWLANYGAVEINPWTSRAGRPDRPTSALIDIDPGPKTTWDETLVLARLYRTALEHLGVVACPKVSGQRGIQIFVPVEPRYSFTQTRDWVEVLSRAVGATVSELVSWEWSKDRRDGLARLDYTQNAVNKTLVAPYSVRPTPHASVSVPIEWSELDDPALDPSGWTIRTVPDRIARLGDLFAPVLDVQQALPTLS
jgi:bifunctional non-homologous end joining protein LigD